MGVIPPPPPRYKVVEIVRPTPLDAAAEATFEGWVAEGGTRTLEEYVRSELVTVDVWDPRPGVPMILRGRAVLIPADKPPPPPAPPPKRFP